MTDLTKLTPATARALSPGQVLRDHEVGGLHLVAAKSGRLSWMLYYRNREGIERRPKIGAFPEMSVSAARQVAKQLKEKVAAGEDPSEEWQLGRAAPTVRDLVHRYVNEYAPARVESGQLKPETLKDNTRLATTYIEPGLGHMKVADVTQAHVDRFLKDVRARKYSPGGFRHAKKTEAPSTANHVRVLLRHLFELARYAFHFAILKVDGVPMNPVAKTIVYQIPKRRRKLERSELAELSKALHRLALVQPAHAACIWTLLLTGARVSEIEHARKDELTPDGMALMKRDHKTMRIIGDKVIPLPAPARALLSCTPPSDSERLFGDIAIRKAWDRVRREAGCRDLQLLDLRRTFASFALDAGSTLDQIGQVLGHTQTQTTRGYAWLGEMAKRRVTDATAAEIMGGAELPLDQLISDLG